MRLLALVSGLIAPAALIILLGSCQTAKDSLNPSGYRPLLPEAAGEESETALPLPELALSGFVPLISHDRVENDPELPLPVFQEDGEPEIPAAVPTPAPPRLDELARAETGETPRLAVPQDFQEDTVSVEPASAEIEPVVTTPPVRVTPPAEESVKKEGEEATVPVVFREKTLASGDMGLLDLEGSDWYFLKAAEGGKVDFVDRTTLEDKSLFSFQFPGIGTYRLIFQRQNHSTGEMDQAEILVRVLDREDITLSDSPAETVPEEEISTEPGDGESAGGEIADLVLAAERLDEIEEDPEMVEETLELLEFLVDAASDDESLAEYYYRMARTLEMNTRFQDLRRAYQTYEYIEDTFFLTDYYELAEERIRYLDRHFFKLR